MNSFVNKKEDSKCTQKKKKIENKAPSWPHRKVEEEEKSKPIHPARKGKDGYYKLEIWQSLFLNRGHQFDQVR